MSTYLGQNFLKDAQIINIIEDSIEKLYRQTGAKALVEIGPGKGAITRKIFQISSCFFAIEKDVSLKSSLEGVGLKENQIIFGDVLEQDISSLLQKRGLREQNAIVVGNLPYYITSPIFKHFFWKEEPKLLGGFFMIQNEVGEKIVSNAKKKSYLWWLLNRAYVIEYVKMVPAKCFSPAPKVKSCLVRFIKKDVVEGVGYDVLEDFLNCFSPYSRKTLGRIEKILEKKGCGNYSIPELFKMKRLEELAWEDLGEILKSS